MRTDRLTWSEVLAPAGEFVACAGVLLAIAATGARTSHGKSVMDLLRDGTLALPIAGTAVAALLVFVRSRGLRVIAAVLVAASNGTILVMRCGFGIRAAGLDLLQYGSAAIAAGLTLWLFTYDRGPGEPADTRRRPTARR